MLAAGLVLVPAGNALFMALLREPFAAFLWYHVLACAALPFFYGLAVRKRGLREVMTSLGFAKPARKPMLACLAAGAGVAAASVAFALILKRSLAPAVSALSSSPLFPLAFVYTLLLNPVFEELFWRGFLHDLADGFNGRKLLRVVNALSFASFHAFLVYGFTGDAALCAALTAAVAAMGFLFALAREKARSLWASIALHALTAIGYMSVFLV